MTCPVLLRKLRRDTRGAAIVEFALTMPLFMMVLMGIYDFSWQIYGKSVLSGAVAQAARAATLEGNNLDQAGLDDAVESQVQNVFRNAELTFQRQAYQDFQSVNSPESFSDNNGNGSRDTGECYEDANANGSWDEDRGSEGNGNADDVVLYTVSMEFSRILPVWKMLGQPQEKTITAKSVMRNQPFAAATDATVVICS